MCCLPFIIFPVNYNRISIYFIVHRKRILFSKISRLDFSNIFHSVILCEMMLTDFDLWINKDTLFLNIESMLILYVSAFAFNLILLFFEITFQICLHHCKVQKMDSTPMLLLLHTNRSLH